MSPIACSLRRFLWAAGLTFVFCLVAIAILNALVDPYAVQNNTWVQLPRRCKVKTLDCQRLTKAADIIHQKPKAILLGTSRILEGMDAESVSEVLGVETYNLGISSASMEEIFAYFQHALFHQPDLKIVVIGLDFFSFNQLHLCAPDFSTERLGCAEWPLRQVIPLVLSWDAIVASTDTLKTAYRHQIKGQLVDRQYVDYGGSIDEALVEHHARKRRPDFYELERFVLEGFADIPQNYGAFTLDHAAIRRFQQMAKICAERGIVFKPFISPCRAIYWQLLYEKDLWATLESWKRALVQAADIWDFSGATPLSAEPFEPLEHSHFFESSHYRPHVGLEIAHVLFNNAVSPNGHRLTQENIDAHLETLRRDQIQWAGANPQTLEFLHSIGLNPGAIDDAF